MVWCKYHGVQYWSLVGASGKVASVSTYQTFAKLYIKKVSLNFVFCVWKNTLELSKVSKDTFKLNFQIKFENIFIVLVLDGNSSFQKYFLTLKYLKLPLNLRKVKSTHTINLRIETVDG